MAFRFGPFGGPSKEEKKQRTIERQVEAKEAEVIAIGPTASAASRGDLLDSARQKSQDKLKKRRGGASAATFGFNLGTANIGSLKLGAR